jgi:hypothetical protein
MVKTYFSTQSDRQLLTETNWMIISNGITDISSREFQFVLSHQKEYAAITSPERVEKKILFLVNSLLNPMVLAKDTVNYFIQRKPVAAIHLFKVDSLLFNFDILLFQTTGNWSAYKKVTLASVETYVWNNYSKINEIADAYLKNIVDKSALAKAVKWLQRSLELHEEYGTCILCARLYLKMDQKQDAILMLQKGKSIAQKDGWDYTEGDKLLEELKKE